MSEANQQSSTSSFYDSPEAALKAPPEELLYLACLHEGTGVDATRLPRRGRRRATGRVVHETPMPNVGRRASPLRLEPLQLGVPRARSLASDRAGLSLVADPRPQRGRRSPPTAHREGHRDRRSWSRRPATRGRTPCIACRATTSS